MLLFFKNKKKLREGIDFLKRRLKSAKNGKLSRFLILKALRHIIIDFPSNIIINLHNMTQINKNSLAAKGLTSNGL